MKVGAAACAEAWHGRMFRIRIPILLFFLFLVFPFGGSFLSAADALIWEIRHPEHPGVLFLAGSVHLGHADMYPLDRVYDEALGKSDHLCFEIASPDLLKTAAFTIKNGMYPVRSKEDLRTLLGETVFQSLCRLVPSAAPRSLARMKPWVVSGLLEVELAKGLDFSARAGMESVFHAAAAGRPERSLETEEEQLTSMADPVLEGELLADIRKNVASPEKLRSSIRAVVPAIREGKTEGILRILEEDRKDAPGVYRVLILQRNRRMAERLFEMLKEEKTGFVLAGAGHCVGPESVPEILREKGCTAVRLKFTGTPGELRPKEMEK